MKPLLKFFNYFPLQGVRVYDPGKGVSDHLESESRCLPHVSHYLLNTGNWGYYRRQVICPTFPWISCSCPYLCCCCCSVALSCSILWYPMDCSTPGFPVLLHLPELAQTQGLWIGDAIQHLVLCHPLLLLPSIFPSIRVFSNELVLRIRWPKKIRNY